MDPDLILRECRDQMKKAVEHLTHELRGVRTGRASTGLIDSVKVDCYGSTTELRNLARLSTADGTQILIKPFDPGTVREIVKAIERADLGLNPQSDGKTIRVPVPTLSGERRKQIASQVKGIGESAKVSVRNVRREANRHVDHSEKDKSNTLSEDNAKRLKNEIQEVTRETEKEVDDLTRTKTAEILEV